MTTENTASGGGADDLDLYAEAPTKGTTPEPQSDTIPEKYKGKTVEDLIKMHSNAERKLGEQGQEIGTLRRLTDEVIGLKKPTTQKTEERKPVTVDALLSDPEKAIRDAVANSDVSQRLEAAEARNARLEASITEERFTAKHKDFTKDIEDPTFIAWVNKNPLRQALAAETAKKNFQAADNLWDMWTEYKELTSESASESKAQAKKPVISTVKSAPGSSNKGKPIYSRAKVMEFKTRVANGDPAALAKWKDPAFQDALHLAYAEERVR